MVKLFYATVYILTITSGLIIWTKVVIRPVVL